MSLDGVLLECWGIIRPQAFASTRPATFDLIAHALADEIDVMPLDATFRGPAFQWDGPIPALPERPVPTATVSEPTVAQPRLQARSSRLSPSAEDAACRRRALTSWCAIFDRMGDAFGASRKTGGTNTPEALADFMEIKATSTLLCRASAWSLFMRYADAEGFDPATLDEPTAFAYLSHLERTGAPPSRGPSFLKTCHFAAGSCEFAMGHTIAISARCVGKAAKSQASAKTQRQRDPLKAIWVMIAEEEIVKVDAGSDEAVLTEEEAEMLGFLIFCTHTRSRASDAARIATEPTLDETEDKHAAFSSFIEAETTGDKTKTGQTAKRARLLVPVVGLSRGIADTPWARAWLSLRDKLFLNAKTDECLQLELMADGTYGRGRILPGQATTWLRALLLKLGATAEELGNVGSHSCKATLLSIAAKGGLNRDTRRTLGGHSQTGDRSVDVYSRDLLAAPLRELAHLLAKVRVGAFDPDASRSGRWTQCLPQNADLKCAQCEQPLLYGKVSACPCGRWVHCDPSCSLACTRCDGVFCKFCNNRETHDCTKASAIPDVLLEDGDISEADSNDDSDLEVAMMTLEEADATEQADEDQKLFLTKGFAAASEAAIPDEGILIHKVYGTVHRATGECNTACGIRGSDLTFTFTTDKNDLEGCKLCWRSGCAPWEQALVVVPEDVVASSDSSSSCSETEKADAEDAFAGINFEEL